MPLLSSAVKAFASNGPVLAAFVQVRGYAIFVHIVERQSRPLAEATFQIHRVQGIAKTLVVYECCGARGNAGGATGDTADFHGYHQNQIRHGADRSTRTGETSPGSDTL